MWTPPLLTGEFNVCRYSPGSRRDSRGDAALHTSHLPAICVEALLTMDEHFGDGMR